MDAIVSMFYHKIKPRRFNRKIYFNVFDIIFKDLLKTQCKVITMYVELSRTSSKVD